MPSILSRLFSFVGKGESKPYCSVVVPAAGQSSRMQGENKLFTIINDIPVLALTLEALERCELFDEIVIAAQPEKIIEISNLCVQYKIDKVSKVITGGKTRAESVLAGVLEVSDKAEYIAVHDAARPFVTQKLLAEVTQAAFLHNAAVPAVPVKDTLKVVKDGYVVSTPERSQYAAIQTPQVFRHEMLKGALTKALEDRIEVTDDASAVERLGVSIKVVSGDYKNIKITTPDDIALARVLMEERDVW